MQETAVQKPDSAMQPEHWYDALPRPAYASLERVPVTEDWFEVYRIQPDLYAIYEPGHFQEVISYLITGSEKALLVDTGLGMGNIRKVVEELTSLPVLVMNTHTHFDHIGGNALFDTVYAPDHPEARRRLSAGATAAELAAEVTEGSNARPWPEGFDPAHYTIAPCAFTPAPEGTVFDLGVPSIVRSITGNPFNPSVYLIGVVALSINSGAYTTELIRSAIQAVDAGQWEASRTLGLGYRQMMRFIILPQAFKRIIPPLVSEFITLIKDSSLLSTIGVVELLQSAKTIGTYTYNYVPPLLMASVVYLALTLTISRFSSKLEERMALSD